MLSDKLIPEEDNSHNINYCELSICLLFMTVLSIVLIMLVVAYIHI